MAKPGTECPTAWATEQRDLAGCAIPYLEGKPVLISPLGSSALLLPVFPSTERLEAFMQGSGLPFDKVRVITDPDVLKNELPREIGVAHDPHFLENGHVGWSELVRGS